MGYFGECVWHGVQLSTVKPSGVQDPPFVQETTSKAVLDPTTIEDEPLLNHCIFKCVYIKLGEAPVL